MSPYEARDNDQSESSLVFVGGFPSGGTDLTKTILNAHPNINLAGEFPLLHTIAQHGFSSGDEPLDTEEEVREFVELVRALDVYENAAREIDLSPGQTVQQVVRQLLGGTGFHVWGNKTPQNTERLEMLKSIFPSARFLIVVRDPRDTALSWNSKWGKSPLWAAEKWNERMQSAVAQASEPATDVKLLKFEELLAAPQSVLRDVCDWLSIEFSERMLRHEDFTTEIVDGKRNYGQPISAGNSGKWKTADPGLIQRIEELALPAMEMLGYNPVHASRHAPLTTWEWRRAQVGDGLALVTVGNRSRTDNSLRQRLRDVMGYVERRVRS